APLPDADRLAGRAVLVRHGDGTTRGWTLQRVENTPGGARLYVREEPGFAIDPATHQARYYQFPRPTFPGPHPFRVSRIAAPAAPTGRRHPPRDTPRPPRPPASTARSVPKIPPTVTHGSIDLLTAADVKPI